MYQDLLEMERKLDWTTTRKKAEVQDALGRNPTVSRLDTSILPTSQHLEDNAHPPAVPQSQHFRPGMADRI